MKNINECVQLSMSYHRDRLKNHVQAMRFYLNVQDHSYASHL
jgi:hypothetical protein